MSNLRIYIIEDEPLIVATIEIALKKHGYVVLGDGDNYNTVLTEIQRIKPDLVLIDIQLSGPKDGVDCAMELDRKQQPYIFLTSQTDAETITRVKLTNPLGYVVKPFTETGLCSNIELAWHNYSEKQNHFITIKNKGKLLRLNENNIHYLKAYDNYCYIITASERYLVPHTLKHILNQLKSNFFMKSHRSYAVNLKHIDTVEKNTIVLKEENIPISASQKSLLISKLKNL